MSIGTGKVNKNKPKEGLKTSSPAKVYQSRASKPSNVAALNAAPAAGTDAPLIDNLNAKMDELLAALKK